MGGQVVTHLLLSVRVILNLCLEEGPLVICVVIYPFTEMIPKIKASALRTDQNQSSLELHLS